MGFRTLVGSLVAAAPAAGLLAALHACPAWAIKVCQYLRRLAERPSLSFLLLLSLCTALRLALLPLFPVPSPRSHDEFSNLLAADTFLDGRLANPPHPLWRHFETHIVLQHPTYASYRPPGPGLLLAFGEVVFSSAWAGMLLSSALMCGALYWALSGWIPRFWALLGGLIAVFNIGLFSYWTNGYWGGSVSALGAMLVFGATGRIMRAFANEATGLGPAGIWFGLGLIPLMLTRPYEGSAFVLGCGGVLLPRLWRRRKDIRFIAAAVIPVVTAGCAVVSWTAYYNYRVAGNALESPYMIGVNRYHVSGPFLWDTEHPQAWTNRELWDVAWTAKSVVRAPLFAASDAGLFLENTSVEKNAAGTDSICAVSLRSRIGALGQTRLRSRRSGGVISGDAAGPSLRLGSALAWRPGRAAPWNRPGAGDCAVTVCLEASPVSYY